MTDTNVSQDNKGKKKQTPVETHIVNILCTAMEHFHIFLGPMTPVFNPHKLQNGYKSSHFILSRVTFL